VALTGFTFPIANMPLAAQHLTYLEPVQRCQLNRPYMPHCARWTT
jgi:hypothetical protein